MDVRWVVQGNLGQSSDVAKLLAFLAQLGIPHRTLQVIPFDDTPPDEPAEGRVVFYGSTTLMKNVAREGRWTPGVFYDEARFAFGALRAGYGEALLNADSEVTTLAELTSRALDPETLLFVRPVLDLKQFTGEVFSFAELATWRTRLEHARGDLTLATEVQIAAPKEVLAEWRTVVVEGRVVAASQYKLEGGAFISDEVPRPVWDFAGEMAARYQPAGVFVLDVAETPAGMRVVETNCFNSAGLYWCDVHAVVTAVTDYARRMKG